jgi:RNA polymerase sigma factor (sigma-70 family)
VGTTTTAQSEPNKTQHVFATTNWSVVLAAARNDTTRAQIALEQLCGTYWYPLYAYVRRRGHSAHDAEDLTQALFASLLEHQSFANADRQRGRFRSFLLGAMNHFLATHWQKQQTLKRGAGQYTLSLDGLTAEKRFELQAQDQLPPDKAFDKEWATALLDKVLTQLEDEYRRNDNLAMFNLLKRTLAGSRESQPYAELAREMEISEGAVKTTVHRLRKRYRELLQEEIANTVESEAEVQEEMTYLFKAIAGR